MADIAGLYKSNQSYNPKIDYNVSYKETGRTVSNVTYEFTVTYNRLNGSYGYDVQINYNIGGATGNRELKANNDWGSWSSVTWSVTCSTNAAGGTVSAKIYSWSNNDGTHSQNGFNTGGQTAKKSTFNTAPTQPGAMTIAGSTVAKYVAENTTSIAMSWGASTDANGNLSGYRVRARSEERRVGKG